MLTMSSSQKSNCMKQHWSMHIYLTFLETNYDRILINVKGSKDLASNSNESELCYLFKSQTLHLTKQMKIKL